MRGRQVVIPARLWSIHGLATYMDWLADGMVAVRHVRDGYSSLFSGRNNPLDEAGAGRGDKSRGGDAGCDGLSAKGGARRRMLVHHSTLGEQSRDQYVLAAQEGDGREQGTAVGNETSGTRRWARRNWTGHHRRILTV